MMGLAGVRRCELEAVCVVGVEKRTGCARDTEGEVGCAPAAAAGTVSRQLRNVRELVNAAVRDA